MSLHYLVKYLCSKNRYAHEVIKANCHVRLSHSKTHFYDIFLVRYLIFNSVTKRSSHRLHKKIPLLIVQNCCCKMPHTISSRPVTDEASLSLIKSKLVYSSLIFVDIKLTLVCLLKWHDSTGHKTLPITSVQ